MSFNGKNFVKTPCESCVKESVCQYAASLKNTEVKTEHPFLDISIKCKEFYGERNYMEKPATR